MGRTVGTQSTDDPAIRPSPDQGKTRQDWEIDARPLGLSLDLVLTFAVVFCLGWASAVPGTWWVSIPIGILGAAHFYILRRGARRVADARAAAVTAGMYAARAERQVLPQYLVFHNPPAGAELDEMIKSWGTKIGPVVAGPPPVQYQPVREDWTATFHGGPLDGTEQKLPADPLGLPPLAHVHNHIPIDALKFGEQRPTADPRAYYRLVELHPADHRADYYERPAGFTVTTADYERMRRKLDET